MEQNKLTIKINKPVAEVFEFTTNPKNTPKWIEWMHTEEANEWPVKLGSTYRNKSSEDGEWDNYVVSLYEPNKFFELTSKDGAYQVKYTYTSLSETETELEYFEWMNDGELGNPFPQSAMEKLKELMEK